MTDKVCFKCEEAKPHTLKFFRKVSTKTGLSGVCRVCTNSQSREWARKNKEKRKEVCAKSYKKNKNKIRKKAAQKRKDNHKEFLKKEAEYREENRETLRQRSSDYYYNNKNRCKESAKKWSEKNAEKVKELSKFYNELYKPIRNANNKVKRKEDSFFRTSLNIRTVLNRLTNKSKKSKSIEIIGCDFKFLDKHLRKTFEKNYKVKWEDRFLEHLHIDHIQPLSLATNIESLYQLNYYTNLQYLYKTDNLKKSKKVDWKLILSESDFFIDLNVGMSSE